MENIKIVMGPACAGKSYFIKENFPTATVIDLYDYQKTRPYLNSEGIMESYEECKNALVEAIKENKEEIVLEHTLLKAKRRKVYIDAIREVTDKPIIIYVVLPSREILKKFSKLRGVNYDDLDIDLILDVLEIPTKEEGFASVIMVD